MNYCVVVFFVVLVISTVQWFIDGRKNFTGPRIDMEVLASGGTVGMTLEGEGIDKTNTSETGNGVLNENGMEKKISHTNGV